MMLRWLRLVGKLICIMLVANACLEPYTAPRIRERLGILVVDGLLVPNDTTVVKLTRTRSLDSSEPVTSEADASVRIESDGGLTYPLTEKESGVYIVPPLDLDVTSKYRLHIRTQDTREYASLFVPLRESALLDSTTWREDTIKETIRFNIYAHDPKNITWYYLWTYDETWEYVSSTTSQLYYENGEMLFRKLDTELYYCWKTIETNNVFINTTKALSADVVNDFKLFELPQSDRKLYFGYSILVRQYALTEEAYNYWAVTKKNSEELGTLFDPLPSQPVGNMSCISDPGEDVLGFFTASTVSEGRVIFSRQKIIGPSIPYTPTGYEFCTLNLIPPELISEESLSGKLVHQREYANGTFIGFSVGTEECLDCRKKGGTNIKPDYWF